MTVTYMDISTRRGTVLPLDQRRRDALANYARLAADDAGIPAQAFVRKVWGLKEYEAKDLLKGNASEALWERIVKSRHPEHGGWKVVLPVVAAMIGKTVEEHLTEERRKHVELARRSGALVRDLRAVDPVRPDRSAGLDASAHRERRAHDG
jgi:hypothetical protein